MPGANERDFYDEVAERLPNPQLIFLNYGYAEASSEPCLWIAPSDRDHKYHLNLVKHVMSGMELAGRTVLEVGSGRGGNCYYMSRYTRAERIYGVDLCEANVQFCRAVHRLPNVVFLRGDAEQLPFRSETFDVVLNLESSHCYPHFDQFLAEVHRVLKPQGTFCYADLWFLEFLELDWKYRKQALDLVPFILLSEEDISEPVFQALKSKEGFVERIRAMADEGDREFVEEVVERLKVVRLMLAASQFSYRVWRFRKP
jgi:ubiquinone/menaquinone biosynthesis C-methylase UbiE